MFEDAPRCSKMCGDADLSRSLRPVGEGLAPPAVSHPGTPVPVGAAISRPRFRTPEGTPVSLAENMIYCIKRAVEDAGPYKRR